MTAVQYPGRIDQKDSKAYFQAAPNHKDDELWTATIPKNSIIVTRLDSNYLDKKSNAEIDKEAKRVSWLPVTSNYSDFDRERLIPTLI